MFVKDTRSIPIRHSHCLDNANRIRSLHRPGTETGPPAWQASILPVNHQCPHGVFALTISKCICIKNICSAKSLDVFFIELFSTSIFIVQSNASFASVVYFLAMHKYEKWNHMFFFSLSLITNLSDCVKLKKCFFKKIIVAHYVILLAIARWNKLQSVTPSICP